jgi:hypothetical protein
LLSTSTDPAERVATLPAPPGPEPVPPISPLDTTLYVGPGSFETQFNAAIAGMHDPENSPEESGAWLLLALGVAIPGSAEELSRRFVVNLPFTAHNAGRRLGEHSARAAEFSARGQTEEVVVETLESVVSFSEGFVALGSIAAPISGIRSPGSASAAIELEGSLVVEVNEIKPLNVDGIRAGLRQGGARVGPGERFGLITYDLDGNIYYQIYENPSVQGQLGREVYSQYLGKVSMPKAATPQTLGQAMETPIRDLFSRAKNVPLAPKASSCANGADIVVPMGGR